MRYQLSVRPIVEKDLKTIPDPFQSRVRAAIASLADDPRPPGSLKLTAMGGRYRIRIGMYRVVYEIVDDRLIITVVAVGERAAIYRLVKHRP